MLSMRGGTGLEVELLIEELTGWIEDTSYSVSCVRKRGCLTLQDFKQ